MSILGTLFGYDQRIDNLKEMIVSKDAEWDAVRRFYASALDSSLASASEDNKPFASAEAERLGPLNSIVYSAITMEISCALEAELQVGSGPDENFVPSPNHPLLVQLSHPNPNQTWAEFLASMIWSLELTDQFYAHLINNTLIPIPASQVSRMNNIEGWPIGYKVRAETISPQEMLWMYKPAPGNPAEAASPINGCAREIRLDNMRGEYQYRQMDNSRYPSAIIFAGPGMSQKDREQMKTDWTVKLGGKNTAKPIVISIEGKEDGSRVEFPSPLSDSDWASLERYAESRICACLHMSPVIVHLQVSKDLATYAGKESEIRMFYCGKMMETWSSIANGLTRGLLYDKGIYDLRFRFNSEPVMSRLAPEAEPQATGEPNAPTE